MKIIEAMKQIKDLQRKASDIRDNINKYHADLDVEAPTYGTPDDQKKIINGWLQAHSDIIKLIGDLRARIQKTNVLTPLVIELGDTKVTKTINQWLHRRKDLAALEVKCWSMLNDKGIQPSYQSKKTTGDVIEAKIRRYYDPKERDTKIDLYKSEPLKIDGALEVVNAITDLVE